MQVDWKRCIHVADCWEQFEEVHNKNFRSWCEYQPDAKLQGRDGSTL